MLIWGASPLSDSYQSSPVAFWELLRASCKVLGVFWSQRHLAGSSQ